MNTDINTCWTLYNGFDPRPSYENYPFTGEAALKKLIEEGNLTIIYVHGTPRSGSTLSGRIFTELAHQGHHQPQRAPRPGISPRALRLPHR